MRSFIQGLLCAWICAGCWEYWGVQGQVAKWWGGRGAPWLRTGSGSGIWLKG